MAYSNRGNNVTYRPSHEFNDHYYHRVNADQRLKDRRRPAFYARLRGDI